MQEHIIGALAPR